MNLYARLGGGQRHVQPRLSRQPQDVPEALFAASEAKIVIQIRCANAWRMSFAKIHRGVRDGGNFAGGTGPVINGQVMIRGDLELVPFPRRAAIEIPVDVAGKVHAGGRVGCAVKCHGQGRGRADLIGHANVPLTGQPRGAVWQGQCKGHAVAGLRRDLPDPEMHAFRPRVQVSFTFFVALKLIHHPFQPHTRIADPVGDRADDGAKVAHGGFVILQLVRPKYQTVRNAPQAHVLHNRPQGQDADGQITGTDGDLFDILAALCCSEMRHHPASQCTPAAGIVVPCQSCAWLA